MTVSSTYEDEMEKRCSRGGEEVPAEDLGSGGRRVGSGTAAGLMGGRSE